MVYIKATASKSTRGKALYKYLGVKAVRKTPVKKTQKKRRFKPGSKWIAKMTVKLFSY